jgi:glycosyl transferase family 25
MRSRTILLVSLSLLILVLVCTPTGYFVLHDSNLAAIPHNNSYNKLNGIGIYLINLDRSKKRLTYVQPKIEQLNLPWKRISAVDGVKLSQADLRRNVDLQTYNTLLGHNPRLGTIGCSLSHINFWQKFLASTYEFALVFEDDISFEPHKLDAAINHVIANPNLWDIASFEVSHHGLPLTIKNFADHTRMVVYLTEIAHTGAYIINRKAAEKLLQKALPIIMPIDHYFSRAWEFNLKFVGIEPRLVTQSYGDSEIEATKRNTSNKQETSLPLLKSAHKKLYKLQSYIIRFLYNFRLYLLSTVY